MTACCTEADLALGVGDAPTPTPAAAPSAFGLILRMISVLGEIVALPGLLSWGVVGWGVGDLSLGVAAFLALDFVVFSPLGAGAFLALGCLGFLVVVAGDLSVVAGSAGGSVAADMGCCGGALVRASRSAGARVPICSWCWCWRCCCCCCWWWN
ncbi:hypothetical protein BX661DRAFT_179920 [Kickxella alabastrina]|uniref:uncharacterized protein n=1 Tax=Kickxella alabastrina TaxID=61397 RepID=UPI00221E66D2|nr:uncharacterized protein BX661DRAFT_179920 [Kickxella alabastrina]KAI7832165.1 hypothetical protein BX661DRAFT_179920 [Kickxella alabastrina]